MKIYLAAALAILFGRTGAVFGAEADKLRSVFPAKDIKKIEIITDSGDIRIYSSTSAEIGVEQYPDNAEACNVSMKAEGGRLKLKALSKPGKKGDFRKGFKVFAPTGPQILAISDSGDVGINGAGGEVEARTGSGEIKARGLTGNLKAESGSGKVIVDGTAGKASVETASGDVELGGVAGAAQARTSSGGISARNLRGGLKAATSSGNVFLDGADGAVEVKTVSGGIEGLMKVSERTGQIRLETVSGNISVGFPRDAAIAVTVRSDTGETHSEFSDETGTPVRAVSISGDVSITGGK